ncbi:MAG: cytochrome b/b6 domain-containing protein [Lysobacterales bacterium]|jgi:thiosulfate reductase cytochrome b subunit
MTMTNAIHRHHETHREERVYLHPLPVRVWHWANALGFILLIISGLQIRYVDILGLMSFEAAVRMHNWVGFAVIANWFLWFIYYVSSDRITNYHPDLDAVSFFQRYFRQAGYYSWGIFQGEDKPHKVDPHDKFNPMQKLTYQFVMFITAPVTFLTGLMMWDVKRFEGLIELVGGIRVVNTIHVLMMILFVFFIFLHGYMGFLGHKPLDHFKEMFTGYEEPHD